MYVFLGEHNGMVDMMNNLDSRGLLATGEYVLLHTDLFTYDNAQKYFQRQYSAAPWSRYTVGLREFEAGKRIFCQSLTFECLVLYE